MNTAVMTSTTRRAHAANAVPKAGPALSRRVLDGLHAGEFCIAYQGIYRVDNGELAQMEALIRWRHPDYGMLLPGAFCATFDDPEVIRAVTWFVIDAVARDLAAWRARGGARYPVAVNVPPSVVVVPGFVERMEAVCRTHGITSDCLEIELSENEDLACFPSLRKLVQRLRDRGVNIAMDDFGTGYACLAALGPIAFGTVKIARELLTEAPRCPNASMVFSSVLAMLSRLKVTVIVEGVETATQAQWLAQWPQLMAQGFHLARPAFGIGEVPGAQMAASAAMARRRPHANRMRFANAA